MGVFELIGELAESDDPFKLEADGEDVYHAFPEDSNAAKSEWGAIATHLKTIGNDFYKEKNYEKAIAKYSKALRYISDDDESSKPVAIACLLN
eukprot:Awhi_evm1s8053